MPTKNSYAALNNNVNLNDDTVQQQPKPNTPKTPKVKPIFLKRETNFPTLIQSIKTALPEVKFDAKNSGEFIKIIPSSENNHRALTTHVKNNNIKSFILPMGITRPLKVVIRGLPIDTPKEEIEKELIELGFPVIKTAQLISRKHQGRPMPLFQVQLQDTEEGRKINQLETLFHLVIKVETYRSPFRVQQCHNCLYFHHHSDNCLLDPRCAKCGDGHTTKTCPLGEGKAENPICANCNGTHSAKFRGCIKFPKPRTTVRTLLPGVSFANAVKSVNMTPDVTPKPTPAPPAHPPTQQSTNTQSNSNSDLNDIAEIGVLLKEMKKLLNIQNFSQLRTIIAQSLVNMQKATTMEDRLLAFYQCADKLMPSLP